MQAQPLYALTRVVRQWHKLLNNRVGHMGTPQTQWLTMIFLQQSGEGLTQSHLARKMAIQNPTLVRLLDALEKRMLIERRPSKEDRRAHHLYMTPQGLEFVEAVQMQAEELQTGLLEGVSQKDLETTLKVMEKTLQNAERML